MNEGLMATRGFDLREEVSIHRTNLKYCGKSPKIRFLSYFYSLLPNIF